MKELSKYPYHLNFTLGGSPWVAEWAVAVWAVAEWAVAEWAVAEWAAGCSCRLGQ
jgi:hypothetical protein